MLGLELVRNRQAVEETARVIQLALGKELILLSCGTFVNVIRVLIPLIITDDQ